MGRFGIPQSSTSRGDAPVPINWRRGLLRVWMVLSAGWVMGWAIYLIIDGLQGGLPTNHHLAVIPVVLLGPPIALLLFGLATGGPSEGSTSITGCGGNRAANNVSTHAKLQAGRIQGNRPVLFALAAWLPHSALLSSKIARVSVCLLTKGVDFCIAWPGRSGEIMFTRLVKSFIANNALSCAQGLETIDAGQGSESVRRCGSGHDGRIRMGRSRGAIASGHSASGRPRSGSATQPNRASRHGGATGCDACLCREVSATCHPAGEFAAKSAARRRRPRRSIACH